MRGVILNFRQGNTIQGDDEDFGGASVRLGAQESSFWRWRVSAIRLQINLDVTPVSGDATGPLSIDRTYTIPLDPSSFPPDETPRTEFDQMIDRLGWSAEDIVTDPATFGLGFGGEIGHDSTAPDTDGWFSPFFFQVYGSLYSSYLEFLTNPAATDVSIVLSGTDARLQAEYGGSFGIYSREIPIFKETGAPTLSGTVSITPYRYYEWTDANGLALYDAETGAIIRRD